MEDCCLFHLDNYLWNLVLDKLSYVDQLRLSEICRRFYNLIKNKLASKRFEEVFKNIYSNPREINDIVEEFNCRAKFYDIKSSDKLYLKYSISILQQELLPKKITAHLFWCQRNYSLFREDCKLCSQVIRFYDEIPEKYLFAENFADLWNLKIQDAFYEKLYYRVQDGRFTCQHFENIYSKLQLVNLFGIIAVHIFFNLSKKYIFLTQFKQKKLLCKFFIGASKIIFLAVCRSININYVESLLKELKPFVDYDSTYLKIPNSFYVNYLEKCI